MLSLLLATLLLAVSAAAWTDMLNLSRRTERLMAWFLLLFSQVVLVELGFGLVGLLQPAYLMAAALFLAAASLAVRALRHRLVRRGSGAAPKGAAPKARAASAEARGDLPRREANQVEAFLLGAAPMLAVVASVYGWLAYLGLHLPVFGWDSQAYHLPTAVWWLQAGRVGLVPSPFIWANSYPQDMTLAFLWQIIWSRSDLTVNLSQMPFALLGALAVYDMARSLEASPRNALWGAALWLFTPLVLMHSMVPYVDLAVAGLFLAALAFAFRFYHRDGYADGYPVASRGGSRGDHSGDPRRDAPDGRAYPFLAGVSAGLILGIKANGAIYVAAVAFILAVGLLRHRGRSAWPAALGSRGWVATLALFAAPVVILGGYWYLRNLLVYGNPLYPVALHLFGRTLLPGSRDIDALIGHIPENRWVTWVRSIFEAARFYTYDNYHNGLGPQFPILAIPAAIAAVAAPSRRSRWLIRATFLIALALVVVQPVKYPRYLLFLAGLGGVAFAFVLESVLQPRVRAAARLAAVALLALGIVAGSVLPDALPEWQTHLALTGTRPAAADFGSARLYRAFADIPDLENPQNRVAFAGGYFVYELFGPHYENRVVYLPPTSEEQWLNDIRANRVTLFFEGQGGLREAPWLRTHPELFQPVWSDGEATLYLVKSAEPRNQVLLRLFEGGMLQ